MDTVTITGIQPFDGRYGLDITGQPMTTREWGWAKRYAGYLPITVDENTFTDPEMIAILAIVALYRNGKIETRDVPDLWERFQDAPFGETVGYEAGEAEQEDDAGPPPRSSDTRPSSNGHDSTTSSGPSETLPSPTGLPRSATSASDPVTSGT